MSKLAVETGFGKLRTYLGIDTTVASLIVNQINRTFLYVCDSIDTLVEGVSITVIFVITIRLSSTETAPRNRSFGSGCAGKSCIVDGLVCNNIASGDSWC